MQQMGEGERGRREGGDSDNGAGIAARPNDKRCPLITASPPNLRCSSSDTYATII